MKRLIIAEVVWSALMVVAILLVYWAYAGCTTPAYLSAIGDSNVVCPNGQVLTPAANDYTNIAVVWFLGWLIILGIWWVSGWVRRRPRRAVKKGIGFK